LAEFDERVTAAYAAKTRDELAPLTADLGVTVVLPSAAVAAGSPAVAGIPAPPSVGIAWEQVPSTGAEVRSTIAVLGGDDRRGRWRPARRSVAVAVMGGVDLDLREASLPPDVLEITAVAVMGGIEITVPEGVAVELHGLSLLGGRSVRTADVPLRSGAPVIRVRGYALMGGIDIRTKSATSGPAASSAPLPPSPPPVPPVPPAPQGPQGPQGPKSLDSA
jgi:hypothetical protein